MAPDPWPDSGSCLPVSALSSQPCYCVLGPSSHQHPAVTSVAPWRMKLAQASVSRQQQQESQPWRGASSPGGLLGLPVPASRHLPCPSGRSSAHTRPGPHSSERPRDPSSRRVWSDRQPLGMVHFGWCPVVEPSRSMPSESGWPGIPAVSVQMLGGQGFGLESSRLAFLLWHHRDLSLCRWAQPRAQPRAQPLPSSQQPRQRPAAF